MADAEQDAQSINRGVLEEIAAMADRMRARRKSTDTRKWLAGRGSHPDVAFEQMLGRFYQRRQWNTGPLFVNQFEKTAEEPEQPAEEPEQPAINEASIRASVRKEVRRFEKRGLWLLVGVLYLGALLNAYADQLGLTSAPLWQRLTMSVFLCTAALFVLWAIRRADD